MKKTKVAIISDLHGNLEASKKVFADIKERNIDKIICLGDIIAKGIHANECIDLVKENCDIVIRGNCDRYFTSEHNLSKIPDSEQKRIRWNQGLLSNENRDYLRNLPFCHEFYMSGSLIRVFHATPYRDDQHILNIDSIDLKSKLFEPSQYTISQNNADIVIYGHIHHQYMDKLYNKTIVNVGSVGNSFDVIRSKSFDSSESGTISAHYVIIEGVYCEQKCNEDISIKFIRVPYDIEKELEKIEKNIEPEGYTFEIRNGIYRDMNRIRTYYESIGIKLKDE